MQIRQIQDSETSTFTYLVWDEETKDAVIIDSVHENFKRDCTLIDELELNLRYALETHLHADHVTAAALLRDRFGAKIALHRQSKSNCADLLLIDDEVIRIGNLNIQVIPTPGHTDHDVSYLVDGVVFTGDALMIRACGRTDFQSGSADKLYSSITQRLFVLSEDTVVFPAHDYHGRNASTIGEERINNPYFSGVDRKGFINKMANLNLDPPQRIAIAVPGNMRCGMEGEMT